MGGMSIFPVAEGVPFDNDVNGFTAEDTQAAIEEVYAIAITDEYNDGGEARGKARILGNTDAFALSFITNNIPRVTIEDDGAFTLRHPAVADSDVIMRTDNGFGGFGIEKRGTSGFMNYMPNSETPQIIAGSPTAASGANQWFLDVDNQGDMYIQTLPGAGASGDIILGDSNLVYPDVDNASDFGTATNRWRTVRAVDFIGDGSQITGIQIDQLTDVDTSTDAPDPGDTLRWNGSNWVPVAPPTVVDTDFYYIIWAEENGGISNGQREWSFGNGATGITNVSMVHDGEIKKAFIEAESTGTSATIDIMVNDVIAGTASFTGNGVYTFPTPIVVSEGDAIGFRTNTVSGSWSDVRVGCGVVQVVSGIRGADGPVGMTGSGSNVIVRDGGVAVPNTPHSELNFINASIADAGGGVVDITIPSIPAGGTAGQKLVKASNSDYDVEWVGSMGSHYQSAQSESESSTTSGTFQTKVSFTTPSLPSGNYRFFYSCEVSNSFNGVLSNINFVVDGESVRTPNMEADSDYLAFSGAATRNKSGVITVSLQYSASGGTCLIRNAFIDMWRIP